MTSELEQIYNTAFDLIEIRLNKKELVYPFTVYLGEGSEKPVVTMSESHTKDTSKLIEKLRSEMKSLIVKENIMAMAICYDMHITNPQTNEKTDAVLVELAGKEDVVKNIYIPYNFNDEVVIKKPFEVISKEVYF